MTAPEAPDFAKAFKRIEQLIAESRKANEANQRKQEATNKKLDDALKSLQTMVIGHYADVHKLIRFHERHIRRINQHLGFKWDDLGPDPDTPRALPDPP